MIVSHEIELSSCSPSRPSELLVLGFTTSKGSPPLILLTPCLMEGVADAFAEYYSLQLSANIRRGQRYNAERALSNGHKIFGFAVDEDKRYIPDPETAPIVTQIFHDYSHGVSMQKMAGT